MSALIRSALIRSPTLHRRRPGGRRSGLVLRDDAKSKKLILSFPINQESSTFRLGIIAGLISY